MLATQLAAIGIVTDSPIAIVGAMAVGPGFGPLGLFPADVLERGSGVEFIYHPGPYS